jgi:hypothetical protein
LRKNDITSSTGEHLFSFENTSLNTLLGQMYDKYEMFELELVSFCAQNCPSDVDADIYLSGLNFTNLDMYPSQTRFNEILLCTHFIEENAIINFTYTASKFIWSFYKKDNVQLSIIVKNFNTNVFITDEFPDFQFVFKIRGLEKPT